MTKKRSENQKWLLAIFITGFFCSTLATVLSNYIHTAISWILCMNLYIMMCGWFYDLLNRVERHRHRHREEEKEKEKE